MRPFILLGDSTCDLPRHLREQYDIDYIPMSYTVDDQEYIASLDWESHSVAEFYQLMRSGKRIFTNQILSVTCREKFTEALKSGKDVVYISCSSALSSSYQSACVIAREVMEQYPEGHIYCVDSLISTLGQGHLLIEAAKLRQDGKSAAETAAYIESIRLKVQMMGYPGSLEYLHRAGRVKASSAFFGNLFGVKPIIISDRLGHNYALKKVKGLNNVRNAVAEMVDEAFTEETLVLSIVHADNLQEANIISEMLQQRHHFCEVRLADIGPIVGASVGPGMVGVFVFGKEVTIEGND